MAPISEVAWSPDNQCLASASDDFTIEITHLTHGCLHRLMGHTAPVISLTYNDSGNLLFTSSMDESIKIWDTFHGAILKTISAHSESVVSLSICPDRDSSVLASGSFDGLIRLFDTRTGHCLKTLTYDKDWKSDDGVVPISQVRFSPNGKFLLVSSFDGIVKIWDCVRGYVVRTFKPSDGESVALKHCCGIDFLAQEGSNSEKLPTPLVVSGYETGQIYCWDSNTKELLYSSANDDLHHVNSPIMSIHCYKNLMCSLSLNGECYVWQWTP